jgi:hypothetical protein
MLCPFCQGTTTVVYGEDREGDESVPPHYYRLRQCVDCARRFPTQERRVVEWANSTGGTIPGSASETERSGLGAAGEQAKSVG